MKNKIFKIALLSLLSLSIVPLINSCVKEDLNVDPKHPFVLPSENFLVSGLYQFAYYTTTPNVNFNNYAFFVQYLAETTYFDETRYDLKTRNQPRNHFNRMYVYTIGNIKNAKNQLPKESNSTVVAANKLATLEIFEVLAWENLVNTFGDIPYSEAYEADSKSNYLAKYDDAKSIYIDLLKRLDAVITTINIAEMGYSSGDVIYKGDMMKWLRTANAIKLRLGINLADTDPALAKGAIESAYLSGLYQNSSDNFTFNFDRGTFTNPYYDNFVASGRNDFIPSEMVINTLKAKNDPRIDTWFTKVEVSTGVFDYVGGRFGYQNPFGTRSHLNTAYFLQNDSPASLISYTEIAFILAEAAQRGFDVGGSALDYYAAAIQASFAESGITNLVAAYLVAHPYDATDWKKSIGEQAYIALFGKAFPAWNFTRRLDQPLLVNPASSLTTTIPFRMLYSDQEYVLNGANVNAATTAIGGDEVSTKLFWDVN